MQITNTRHTEVFLSSCVSDLCMHIYILAFLCLRCVCMQINKPVFLKGKSSLLSMGDGSVYWQVGDVPPRGGELWSNDVWWEDLIKRRWYDDVHSVSIN